MQSPQRRPVPTALTVAGSDPSGGAGLQADLKTFHQHGVYGAAVVTLVTVQNTVGVSRVELLEPALVRAQAEAVLSDVRPRAVKTGALGSPAIIAAVAALPIDVPLVVDPVMVSKHGHPLVSPEAQAALVSHLLPRASLVTPNAREAAALTGRPVETLVDAEHAARAIARMGPRAVVVKAPAVDPREAVDVLWHEGRLVHLRGPRVETPHTHGTGCTFSAAITAGLARGLGLEQAVRAAKDWVARALRQPPDVGAGIGPVDHAAPV
jgi:hydroxymethylpyrimidine/phosphomethylpyrimidine kinase